MIEEQYKRAISILKEHKDKLTTLANRLLEKEVIFKDDLEHIFGKRPYDVIEEPPKSSVEDTAPTEEIDQGDTPSTAKVEEDTAEEKS